MKHLKLIFACLLTAFFSIGQVWAAEVMAYTLEPVATGGNSSPHNSYTAAATTTIDGIEWSVLGNSSMTPWRLGGKGNNCSGADRDVHSNTAISDNISKIVITHGAASSITVNSMTVIVSKQADFSNPVSTLTPEFVASDDVTVNRPDGKDWSNCYYKFVYNLSVSGNSNRFVQFSGAVFYKETGDPSEPSLSLEPSSLELETESNATQTISLTATNFAEAVDNVECAFFSAATCEQGEAISQPAWITNLTDNNSDEVSFDVADNDGAARSVWMKITASKGTESASAVLAISQKLLVVDYATLPFAFNGGKADIANTSGMTENGVDNSDYSDANTKLKFNTTGDWMIIKINADPGKLTYSIKNNSFSGSTFDVQESADGETYTGVVSHTTITGTQNEEHNLKKATRYVKFIYTNKANGNVGLGNIGISAYVEPTAVETPTFSPAAGTYEGTQNVTISCGTEDATIYYTTDGSTPNTGSEVYSSAISVSSTQTIKAFAVKSGLPDSEVAEAAYTITAGPDVFIDLTDGNWGFPSSSGTTETEYTNSETGYKVKCFAANEYKIGTGYFIIGKQNSYIVLPSFSNPIAKIVVVKGDGSSPSGSVVFNIYDGETAVSTAATGCAEDKEFVINNPEGDKTYTLKITSGHNLQLKGFKIYYGAEPAVKKPIISGAEKFVTSATVSLTCTTDGASIYYTTDGSTPSSASTLYEGAFQMNSSCIVKAIAIKGSDESYIVEKSFTKVIPISVADAIVLIPNANDIVDDKCVIGYVCTAGTSLLSGGKMTYYISDDGTETSRLQIFHGKNLDNTSFSAISDLAIGDKVAVFGQLKNYGGNPEMNEGNYIVAKEVATVSAPLFSPDGGGFMGEASVSITSATDGATIYYTTDGSTPDNTSTPYTSALVLSETTTIKAIAYKDEAHSVVVSKTFTKSEPMTVAEAYDALVGDNIANVAVEGIVYKVDKINNNGTATYWISDDGTEGEKVLEVFNGRGVNNANFEADGIQVQDKVIVFGTLTIYEESTKEFASGSRLLSLVRKADPGISWDPESYEVTLSSAFTPADFSEPQLVILGPDAAEAIPAMTFTSDNESLVTVSAGVISWNYMATGTAVVTASFPGDDTYKAVTATCTITVNPEPTVDTRKVAESPAGGFSSVSGNLSGDEISFAAYKGGASNEPNGSNTANELRLYKYQATTQYGGYVTITAKTGCTIDQVVITVGGNCNVGYCKDAEALPTKEDTPIAVSTSSPFDTGTGLDASSVSVVNLDESNQFKIKSITVYYNGDGIDLESIAISGTASVLEYNDGDEFDPAGLVVTGHYSDNSDAVIADGITWAFDPATLSEGDESVSVTATVGEITSSAFVVDGLTVSAAVAPVETTDNVVILATYGTKLYAMSSTNSSNAFAAIEVEEDGSKIVVASAEDKAAIQWTRKSNGLTATFQDAASKYLTATNGSTNLNLGDAECSWKWYASKNAYCIENEDETKLRSFLYYENNKIFKNYALSNAGGNYSNITEVRVIAAENIVVTSPALVYEEVRTGLEIGRFYTVCLPKKIVAVDGATFWNMSKRNADASLAYLEEATAPFAAGTPFIFQATATTLKVAYEGDAVSEPEVNGALRGRLAEGLDQNGIDDVAAATSSDIYMLKNNELRKANGQEGNTMGAYKAYVVYNDLQVAQPVPAPGRRVLSMPMQGESAQGVENIETSEKPMKLMIDGQLFIIRGEKMYDVTGKLVK